MHTHTFTKEPSGWYIELPDYIAKGGNKGDLAMVEGADIMLDIMSDGNSSVTLDLNDSNFDGADKSDRLRGKC